MSVASEEWRKLAAKCRNWGRWGDDDQLGTLNFITPERLAGAASLARRGKAFSLAIPLNADAPMGAHGIRRAPIHLMSMDGGDHDAASRVAGWGGYAERETESLSSMGPFRFNDDWIIMCLQTSTQWDALCHAYYEGEMYNGVPASASTSHGVTRDAIDPVADAAGVQGRGILLDVARHKGVHHLEAGTPIYPQDLEDTAKAQGVEVQEGDIVVVRTGWWTQYAEIGLGNGLTWQAQCPGLSWRATEWLYDHNVGAVASDNVAVEVMVPEDDVLLPFHMIALRDMGMMLGEIWSLEALADDCAADNVYEFFLSAPALKVTGGTGTPVNPIAIK
jgi:kynurenine formamidase